MHVCIFFTYLEKYYFLVACCNAELWVAEILPWLVPQRWLYIRVNLCLFLQQDHHMVCRLLCFNCL